MKYPAHWNGKIKLASQPHGTILMDGQPIGTVRSRYTPGAKTAKGMLTDLVWIPALPDGTVLPHQDTMTNGIEALREMAGAD